MTPAAGGEPPASCTKEQAVAGECLSGYVSAGEQPEVSLVVSATLSGQVDIARAYVDRYRGSRDPGLTAQMEAGIEAALHPNGGNDGTVVSFFRWELRTTETMQVCFDSCTILDTIDVSFVGSLPTSSNDAAFSGELVSRNGVTFDVVKPIENTGMCEVKQDRNLMPDPVVGVHSTCRDAYTTSSWRVPDSTVDLKPNQDEYWRVEYVLTPSQQATDAAGALIRVPKRIVYESPNFHTNGDGVGSF